jgi:RHS repeat-associated protein
VTVSGSDPITLTRVISYTYDPLGRLTAADYSTGENYAYQYDAVGNRTAMTDTQGTHTYTYDAANRLTSVDGIAYTWDKRGNLVNDGVFTYTYSAAGRMVRAENVTATLVYTYNHSGLRVAQSVDGDPTKFSWDWATGIPEMLSDGDALYLVGHETLGQYAGSAWTYYLPDALGSVRQATDSVGAVVSAREWSPYGVEVGSAQAGLGYTGEWYDGDMGMVYLRARWYDVYLNQFVSPDPIVPDYRNPQSINGYVYVLGNPVNYTDPSGFVYVTFDDGPHSNDETILDILKSHNARANFFFHGENVNLDDPLAVDIVWRVVAEGHRLGNHAYRHIDLTEMCFDEMVQTLVDTEYKIKAALSKVMDDQPYRYKSLSSNRRNYIDNVIEHGTGLFRAPGGAITALQKDLLECNPEGAAIWDYDGQCAIGISSPWNVVDWTVDPYDWSIALNEQPAEMVLGRIKNGWCQGIGCIIKIYPSSLGSYGVRTNSDNILLHSWSNPTVEALDDILLWLKEKEYTFDLLEPAWANSGG